MARKWLFQGHQYQVSFYADEGSGYQVKQVISNTSIYYPMLMDVN
jgi:hypothetical protein